MSLIVTGLILIVVGFLAKSVKFEHGLRARLRDTPIMQKISGNIGEIFFVIGLILLITGVADLYYG